MTTTEIFEVKAGIAKPISAKNLLTQAGRVEPTAHEIVTLPAKWAWGQRRIALYPKNSIRPFPVSAPIIQLPGTFGVEDMKNTFGPYLPSIMRRALRVDDGEWKLKDWIILGVASGAFLLSGVTLYLVWKGFHAAGIF